MKNIKKFLALMLVIVMALGMIPLASAAIVPPSGKNVGDFPDFDDIAEEYLEAADVLAALGVY